MKKMKHNPKNKIVISAKNIYKSYKTKNKKIEILNDASIEFETGKLYAIMGHSGSGKSTFINTIGLIDTFDNGSLELCGQKIAHYNDDKLSKIRMENIGFVFQDFKLDNNLNARDNVIFPMLINKQIPKKERKNIANELLEKMDLSNRADHYINELSGGEQQRVAIARALANNPQIILADEPTGNLDKKMEESIFKFLKQLTKGEDGKCIIVVSHSGEIKKYADVVYTIEDGKIIGDNCED